MPASLRFDRNSCQRPGQSGRLRIAREPASLAYDIAASEKIAIPRKAWINHIVGDGPMGAVTFGVRESASNGRLGHLSVHCSCVGSEHRRLRCHDEEGEEQCLTHLINS